MPIELLGLTPAYTVVGAYRLATDPNLYRPVWARSRKSLQRALLFAVPYSVLALPLTRLYVTFVLSRSPLSPKNVHEAAYFGVSPVAYTTWALLAGQVSALIEFLLKRELRKSREEVYEQTVRSRGKPADWWQPYTEEWLVPPVDRAKRAAEKQSFYVRLSSPLVRIVLLRVLLTPLSFIPGLALCVLSAIRSLTMGRLLHRSYFAAKKMTPFEVELWLAEREVGYRLFGFAAALLERIPLVGLVFSISNRIGAAMWAHDLEKRQHAFRSGELKPTKVYQSKTAVIAAQQRASDIPDEVLHGPGGFPSTKGPVKIAGDGSEIGRVAPAPPPLPPREL
ncbi:hypothetical protein NBRC10513v2_002616 [Rhodotorula toruloides]|uniref:BY PROTMAP: gi/472588101/gb/EMS25573.1/ protein of uncharacterized CysZ family [Rhodosporidium toruloides NP11] n=1 Tax=Rhodotorula toruloides TaxID=5286 RepID=A0A0K3CIJ2_RHOTO|nr:hypothetical protein AAT19DRAFT_15688 [Rhodotorula toruloides]